MPLLSLRNLPGIALPLFLIALSLNAYAGDLYIGVQAAPYIAWKDCTLYVYCTNGGADYGKEFDGHSKGMGAHVGYWLSRTGDSRYGIETGYEKLGVYTGSGTFYPNGCSLLYCSGPSFKATWKTEGSLIYLDWIGQIQNNPTPWANGVFAKFGIFRSSTRTTGDYVLGGVPYARELTGAGIALGMGYLAPLTQHLSARAALDLYFRVKVADPSSTSNAFYDTLFNLSLGVDYTF